MRSSLKTYCTVVLCDGVCLAKNLVLMVWSVDPGILL